MAARADGILYSEIAEKEGVSREAVRQAAEYAPAWFVGLVEQRAAARVRLRAYVDYGFSCGLCGKLTVQTNRSQFCSGEHYHAWLALRSHLPGHDEKHRDAVARTNLRRAAEGPIRQSYAEHAHRILSGDRPAKNRQWLTPGSKAEHWAQTAYENGWPIFDLLPEPIRDRIAGVIHADQVCEQCGTPFAGRRDPRRANRFCSKACFFAAGGPRGITPRAVEPTSA